MIFSLYLCAQLRTGRDDAHARQSSNEFGSALAKSHHCHVTIQGKVFAGQAVGATGSEFSFQTLVPGQDSGFLHTHKTHEELYIILKGEGQYQVDGEIFPVSEGTIVRVAPDGKRALKNTGSENLTMLCIQYKANVFTEKDTPMTDGTILQEELKW